MSCSIDNLQFSNVSVIGVRRIYSTVHKMWKFKGDGGFLLTFVVNITPIYMSKCSFLVLDLLID